MIACVSPGFSSANHTINTLRYSDRLKEKTSMMKGRINHNCQQNNFQAIVPHLQNNNLIRENNFMKNIKAVDLLDALDVRKKF
jgi:kinesin family member 2/24